MADTKQALSSLPKPKWNASKEIKTKQAKTQTNKQKTLPIFKDKEKERVSQQMKAVSPTFWKMKREC